MIGRATRRFHVRPIGRAAVLSAILALGAGCTKKEQPVPVQTAPVTRRTIAVETQSTGVVEPINLVEVKSKASGLIIKMPVDVGSVVQPGDLIAQIDTRDVKNQFDQASAVERAAQAKLDVSSTQKKRSDELFAAKVITATEHETALIDYANSQSALVAARTNLDLARQRLEDATVRAQVAGVILTKSVSQGMVITSATSAFGGGTTIVQMADLSHVRMRVLVNETDIGSVRLGQPVTAVMDAYPNRPFRGTVEKIEPQAVVQQNVTMFPVLVSLDNSERALMPGMNGEARMVAERRDNVLSIPVDAVRSLREAPSVATLVGLDPDSVRLQLAAQMRSVRGPAGGPGGDTGVHTGVPLDSLGPGRGGVGRSERPRAAARDGAAGGFAGRGAEGDSARGARRRDGSSIARGGGSPEQRPGGTTGDSIYAPGGPGGTGASSGGGGYGGRANAQFVFVKRGQSFVPRLVRTGVSNFEYVEVRGGLQENDEVALLAAASLQARREQQNERFRGMAGGPLGPASGRGGGGRGGAPH